MRCRLCSRNGKTQHHLIPQRIKRIQAKSNLVPLCCGCHKAVDGSRGYRTAYEHRQRLRLLLTEAEVAYLVGRMSREWLDDEYPMPTWWRRWWLRKELAA